MLSIITPTYNRAATLETTIRSVYSQSIDDLEYIIMDGGSCDGTPDLVARYPQIRFYSEPDEGLYFALNKGLSLMNGQYWAWVNSDDYFVAASLKRMLDQIKGDLTTLAIFASAQIASSKKGGEAILVPAIQEGTLLERVTLDAFSFNAGVFRREVFEKLGGFDTRYKIGADREFLFRFGLNQLSYQHIDDVAYVYQSLPTSLTYGKQSESRIRVNLEEMQMAREYLVGSVPDLCRRWHTRSSVDASIQLLLSGNFAQAFRVYQQGKSIDTGWVGSFCKRLFLALSRRLFSQRLRAKFSRFRHIFTDIN